MAAGRRLAAQGAETAHVDDGRAHEPQLFAQRDEVYPPLPEVDPDEHPHTLHSAGSF